GRGDRQLRAFSSQGMTLQRRQRSGRNRHATSLARFAQAGKRLHGDHRRPRMEIKAVPLPRVRQRPCAGLHWRLHGTPDLAMRTPARVLLCAILACSFAHAATITVTSTADTVAADGACTLREAIAASNNNPVADCGTGEPAPVVDVIAFAIPG